ncbi:MAG: hypothetical protein ACJ8CR_20875 [Roseiflexaceae bacterium]
MAREPPSTVLAPSDQMARRRGSLFDRIMVVLMAWLLGGAYLDVWAHNHLSGLDSFFTLWHAILYTGYFALAIFLGAPPLYKLTRGYPWSRSLPDGYMVSLLGVGMFLLGGVGDLIWHTVFGLERHFEVALSIPHLTLKFSALLIGCGPLSAAWRRIALEETQGWSALWPMVLTAAFVLSGLTYFTGLANPFAYPWAVVGFRAGVAAGTEISSLAGYTQVPNEVGQVLGVLAIIVHTGMLMGLILLLVRRWVLPFGSLALIFSINASLMAAVYGPTQYGLVPIMTLSGLAADGLLGWLRPSVARVAALRVFAFAVPTILYMLYFVVLLWSRGVEWPMTVWTGSIVVAGLFGLGVSYLVVPPESQPEGGGHGSC